MCSSVTHDSLSFHIVGAMWTCISDEVINNPKQMLGQWNEKQWLGQCEHVSQIQSYANPNSDWDALGLMWT